jgi:uncharacterized integral membrane protein
MRSRSVLLVIAILLIAAFAALNWAEVMRPSPLLFGPVVAEAPLGAILLGLLALAVVAFALSAGAIRTSALLESRHHYKELEAQRTLADKAEASRFTELRAWLEENLRDLRERENLRNTELQRELRTQMEGTNRMWAARLSELEQRMDTRFERAGWGRGAAAVAPVTRSEVARSEAMGQEAMRNEALREQAIRDDAVRQQGLRDEPLREHATAEEARMAQMREEERLRDARMQERRDERAVDRPGDQQSGWRRWF